MKRSAGIFLHITSLPGSFGVGDFGYEARKFVDLLERTGVKIWQICPICPTAYGNSPYSTPCSNAGNPLLISPELLRDWGYLKDDDLKEFGERLPEEYVDFNRSFELKDRLIRKAFENFMPNEYYNKFCETETWLDSYIMFLSLSKKFGTVNWSKWEKKYASYNKNALVKYIKDNKKELDYYRFRQFIFHSQWFDLKKYANERGVRIFGDVPYYVSYESSDVWSNQNLFELDSSGNMIRVGGVPPDYFSKDGQLWGTPLYRWDRIRENGNGGRRSGYEWWMNRMKRAFFYNDMVRIDHFRAFESYWAVDGKAQTAKEGVWKKGPGSDFFRAIRENLGSDIELIAEDLGLITQEVNELRDRENLCGMKVFQFAFDGNKDNYYLPYNCTQKSVMYSGTHDNDTIMGWYGSLDEWAKKRVDDYVGGDGDILRRIIREVLASPSVYAILQLVDILGFGSDARFNVPGTVDDRNWSWRFKWEWINESVFDDFKKMLTVFGRG